MIDLVLPTYKWKRWILVQIASFMLQKICSFVCDENILKDMCNFTYMYFTGDILHTFNGNLFSFLYIYIYYIQII